MKISEMQKQAHETSKSKGWWDGVDPVEHVPTALCLVHSEVSEALEDYREGKMATTLSDTGKPCGFGSELADVIIRIGDMAEALGIDLETEIWRKMEYNTQRAYRHGGKRV